MPTIEIYSSEYCGYCRAARRLLDAKGVAYTLHTVDGNPALRREMTERSGRTSVPQIFVDGRGLGGFTDIAELDADGELDALLGIGASAPAGGPPPA